MESNPLERRIDDLVTREQVCLLRFFPFVRLIFVIGGRLCDVVSLPLTVHDSELFKRFSKHFLFNKSQLRVDGVHIKSVYYDCSTEVVILLLKLRGQWRHDFYFLWLSFAIQNDLLLGLFKRLEGRNLDLLRARQRRKII